MQDNREEDSIKPIMTSEEFDKIAPKNKRLIILAMVDAEIKKQGVEGKMVFKPIESGYKANRIKYYSKSGVSVFEEYLSQLNTLPLSFLEVEIRELVGSAKRHFKLS